MATWEELEKKYQEEFLVLLEAGFIACNQADEDSATKLFKAAKLLKPKNTLCDIGAGYLHLHKLELKQACEKFLWVIKQEPNNEMARTLLGVAKSLTPNGATEGERILTEVSKRTQDPYVKDLSHTAIDFVEKFVKKGGSGPAEAKKPRQPKK